MESDLVEVLMKVGQIAKILIIIWESSPDSIVIA